MVRLTTALVASLAATAVTALPVQKRIAQTIADSTAEWVKACDAAGGADQCNAISQVAFQTLLAAGKNCDQQDAADKMVDLAKKLDSDPEMIRLAQLFVQQPRNAPDSLQVPYCQTAPKNAELNGLFHCQFASSDFTKFSGDQTGNLPLGVSAVTPPGSCPAKTDGPVPDGVQLNTLVTSPGNVAAGAADIAGVDDTTPVDDTAVTADSRKRSPRRKPHPTQTVSVVSPVVSGFRFVDKTPTEVEQLLRRFKFVDKTPPQVEQLFGPSATLEDKTSPEIAKLFQRSPHSPHHAHQHGSTAAAGSTGGPLTGNTGFQFVDKTSPEVEQLQRRSFQFVDKTPPALEHIHLGVGAPSPFTPEVEGDTDPLVPNLNRVHDLTTRKNAGTGAPSVLNLDALDFEGETDPLVPDLSRTHDLTTRNNAGIGAFSLPTLDFEGETDPLVPDLSRTHDLTTRYIASRSPHGSHHAHGASSVNQAIPLAASPIVAATSPQPTLAQAPGFPPGTNSQFIGVA
ncbi:hypothetical protein BV25DRAFT_1824301 [Artomyces pyxidatus]|uniref:Uncharacterized protein n=1 Tax=Artomyces pyxidatus TaxID=48021 RepID=A0ACB8T552_9AGAM|nr:hypothetical protein BV25DRAFT_1824301 [Artomyces pyxidatus]